MEFDTQLDENMVIPPKYAIYSAYREITCYATWCAKYSKEIQDDPSGSFAIIMDN